MNRLRWCALIVVAALAACATPTARYEERVRSYGFAALDLDGDGFRHRAYTAAGTPSGTLHVYIEHDGTPWIVSTLPSSDPTPRRPLALELMAQDPAPRLFLGRPCYFATDDARGATCSSGRTSAIPPKWCAAWSRHCGTISRRTRIARSC
jgi:hypothetical protein